MTLPVDGFEGLPGADLVVRGLDDLSHSRPTAEAALVEIAARSLRELGLLVERRTVGSEDAELVLYSRLGARFPAGDVYPLYCAWLDQLVSFLAAFKPRPPVDR